MADSDLPWRFSSSSRMFPNPGRVRQLLELAVIKPAEVSWVLNQWRVQPEWASTMGNLLRREVRKVQSLLRRKPVQPVKPEPTPRTQPVTGLIGFGNSGFSPATVGFSPASYHAYSIRQTLSGRMHRYTRCWACHHPIDNLRMSECGSCKGIVCGCGACFCK